MKKETYFQLVKEIKQLVVANKMARSFVTLYSDKRKTNGGYRTKLYGVNRNTINEAVALVENKYGHLVNVGTTGLSGRYRWETPSLTIRPKTFVHQPTENLM